MGAARWESFTARLIPGIDGGYIFSPVLDYFYGVNSATDEIVAYRTDTLDEKFRFPVGQFVGVRTVGVGRTVVFVYLVYALVRGERF